jgi:hypothetical protein
MQGHDWEPEQQQDLATEWHEEPSAAATGMIWASWKASPMISAIASFMFLTAIRVMQQVFCSSLFYLLPAAAGIRKKQSLSVTGRCR